MSVTRQGWASGRPGAAARPTPVQTGDPAGRTGEQVERTDQQAGRTGHQAGRTDHQAGAPAPLADPARGSLDRLAPARGSLDHLLARLADVAADWAPTAGRLLLGLVFAWFGYHELVHPGVWTGYVPVLSETSNLAVVAVLIHGWILFMLAVAMVAGIAPRAAAALASVLMLEIVISLAVNGLTDTALRDVGVLGLAVCLTGCRQRRLVLRG